MKSLACLLLVIVVGVVAIPHAFGERAATRPPGVPANNWVPINEQFGIVLVSPGPSDAPPQVVTGDPRVLMVGPASNGYFMVRRGNVWTRLSISERPGDAW